MDKEKSINIDSSVNAEKIIPSVPESPTPDDGSNDCIFVPLEIPTERCITPEERKVHRQHHKYDKNKDRSHRERSNHKIDFEPSRNASSENRDKFGQDRHKRAKVHSVEKYERQRHERDRYDRDSNDRNNVEYDRCDPERQEFGYDQKNHHRHYERSRKDREKTLEKSKSKENEDHPRDVFSRLGHKLLDEPSLLTKNAEPLYTRNITREVTFYNDSKMEGKIYDSTVVNDDLITASASLNLGNNTNTAYGIGQRRETKQNKNKDQEYKEKSKLDEVRKKLSMLAKCSTNINSKPIDNVGYKLQTIESSKQQNDRECFNKSDNTIVQDPRLKKQNYASVPQTMTSLTCSHVPISTNRMDPRLRKNSNSSSCSSNSHNQSNEIQKPYSSNQTDHYLSSNAFLEKQGCLTPQTNWDTDNFQSLKNNQSSSVTTLPQGFTKKIQPSPLSPTENWDDEIQEQSSKVFGNYSRCTSNFYSKKESVNLIKSGSPHLTTEVKGFGNNSRSIPQSNSKRSLNGERWDEPKKSFPSTSSARQLGNYSHSISNPFKNGNKKSYSLSKDNNCDENWDDEDNTNNQYSSYELNRKRVLDAEQKEEEARAFVNKSYNSKKVPTNNPFKFNNVGYTPHIDDEMPTSSKFNALLNDKSERIHYLESKKHKEKYDINCSRTYAEYKLKKARLEENKRKMIAETEKLRSNNEPTANSGKIPNVYLPQNINQSDQKNINLIQFKKSSTNDQNKPLKDKCNKNDMSSDAGRLTRNEKETMPDSEKSEQYEKETSLNDTKINQSKDCNTGKNCVSEIMNSDSERSKTPDRSGKETTFNSIKNNKTKTVQHDKYSDIINLDSESNKLLNQGNMISKSEKKQKIETTDHIAKITMKDINQMRNFREVCEPKKRRSSMCEYGSRSLVEKDKLPFANTILYADLQCEARPSHKNTNITEKISNRNTESLANIFKKTDDNCTVSTQNIISGKRRTRTTVNFNEVQQTKTIFNQLRKSTGSNSKQGQKAEKSERSETVQQYDETTSSSIKSSETSQESGNQEVLEGFVQDIFKPNANTDYILGLLGKILPEEKLNLVKTIIKSVQKIEDDEILTTSNTTGDCNKSESENKINKNSKENDQENKEDETPKKRFKKRNELDRLNEDIRDMFMSEGVLTATGKRMCKLVSENKSDEPKETNSSTEKYEKILKRQCTIKLAKIKFSTDRSPKVTKELPPTSSNETQTETSPAQRSPDLEVKKVIGENTNLEEKKSLEESDSDMDESENVGKKANTKNKKGKPKISKKTILKNDGLRNTNVKHHFLSKYASEMCIVCEKKVTFMTSHYHMCHAENYISRLAPTVVKKLKAGVLGVVLFRKKVNGKLTIFHRCPICLQYGNRMFPDWIEHFRTHTGEYYFSCSYCRKGNNKKNQMEAHIKQNCPRGVLVRDDIVDSKMKTVKGYVCHLCNFVQLKSDHLVRHFVEQHELDTKDAKTLGLEVNLMDWSTSEVVDEKRAAVLEKKAQQQKFLCILDEPETLEVMEKVTSEEIYSKSANKSKISVKKEMKTDPDKKDSQTQSSSDQIIPTVNTSLSVETEELSETLNLEKNEKEQTKSNVLKHPKIDPNTSNVFLPTPRDTESPTVAFTEKLKTIQQESNQESKTVNKNENYESMAEKLSQRLKRFTTEAGENKGPANNPVVAASESKSSGLAKNASSDDDDCWVDIDPIDLEDQNKTEEKGADKSKMKTNKKLHRFYASNANRARKIKGSYLNNKRPRSNGLNKPKITDKVVDALRPKIFKFDELNSQVHKSVNAGKILGKEESIDETSLNKYNKQESIEVQDTDSQNDHTDRNSSMLSNVNRIWNVGYSHDGLRIYKYYCLSKECTFLYSNEAVGLETHCLLDHSNLNWEGFCSVCDKIVKDDPLLTVCQEIKHMMDSHIRPSVEINSEVVEVEEEIPRPPRIKIRRLSGDCLSMSPRTSFAQSENLTESQAHPPPISFIRDLGSNLTPINASNVHDILPKSSLGLQITSVRSLNQNKIAESCFPKIASVCSLNPANSVIRATNENSLLKFPRENIRSPEPIVVAETVPVARSKTGNFLITQTLSTQYDANGEQSNMDFHIAVSNTTSSTISTPQQRASTSNPSENMASTQTGMQSANQCSKAPYSCMATNCKFTTRVSVSMLDHLNFHELRSFKTERDYLRCSHCDYVAEDKLKLLQHIHTIHLINDKQSNMMNISITRGDPKTGKNKTKAKAKKTQTDTLQEAIFGIVSRTGKNGMYCI